GKHEGIGDASTDDELVNLVCQRTQNGQLGGHLGTGNDRDHGALGVAERTSEGIEFGLEQRAGASDGGKPGNAMSRRFGTMCSAESIVYIHITQLGHLARKRFVVLLFADVAPAILEQYHLA